MKYIGEAAAKLGDAALLNKYYNLVENDPNLARITQDRIAVDALISQARAADICTQAIEKITFMEDGGMEVVIDPTRFLEAKAQLETTDITLRFRNRIGVEEPTPRLTFEDIENLSQLTDSLYVRPAISDYLDRQYIDLGGLANRSMQPQLSESDKTALAGLAVPSSATERFEQIRQSEAASDQVYLLAKASEGDFPTLPPMRNFTTVNPSEIRDQEDADFWKNDRVTREAQDNRERVSSLSDEASRLPSEIEAEEEEMIEGEEIFDMGQAVLSE
jgi:hypothetical protein